MRQIIIAGVQIVVLKLPRQQQIVPRHLPTELALGLNGQTTLDMLVIKHTPVLQQHLPNQHVTLQTTANLAQQRIATTPLPHTSVQNGYIRHPTALGTSKPSRLATKRRPAALESTATDLNLHPLHRMVTQ